jgi:hypothetical protein
MKHNENAEFEKFQLMRILTMEARLQYEIKKMKWQRMNSIFSERRPLEMCTVTPADIEAVSALLSNATAEQPQNDGSAE